HPRPDDNAFCRDLSVRATGARRACLVIGCGVRGVGVCCAAWQRLLGKEPKEMSQEKGQEIADWGQPLQARIGESGTGGSLSATFTKRFEGGPEIRVEGLEIGNMVGVTVLFGASGA